MGWFDKKDKDGEEPGVGPERASLANLASPEAPRVPTQPAAAAAHAAMHHEHAHDQQPSIFDETADIQGSVEGHGDLILRGTVRGSIHVTGSLLIESKGRVQADVAAREVINAGTVEGNIIASERVRVAATGIVDGDIDAPSIIIDDGGGVEGFIQMEPPGGDELDLEDDEFVPPPPIKGLRSSLPVKPDRPAAPSAPRPAQVLAPPAAPDRSAPPAAAATPSARPTAQAASQASPQPPASAAASPSSTGPLSAEPKSSGGNGNGGNGSGESDEPADATLLSAPAFRAEPGDFDGPLGGDDTKPPNASA